HQSFLTGIMLAQGARQLLGGRKMDEAVTQIIDAAMIQPLLRRGAPRLTGTDFIDKCHEATCLLLSSLYFSNFATTVPISLAPFKRQIRHPDTGLRNPGFQGNNS